MQKTKLIKILSTAILPQFGNISGPINNPIEVDIQTIRELVFSGIRVIEVNPLNRDEEIELDRENCRANNFAVLVDVVVPIVNPTREERKESTKKEDKKKNTEVEPKKEVEEENDFKKK